MNERVGAFVVGALLYVAVFSARAFSLLYRFVEWVDSFFDGPGPGPNAECRA